MKCAVGQHQKSNGHQDVRRQAAMSPRRLPHIHGTRGSSKDHSSKPQQQRAHHRRGLLGLGKQEAGLASKVGGGGGPLQAQVPPQPEVAAAQLGR